ncbi:hypothetical protein WJX73_004915 [Symbiochloris irregularis]|uniref:F-box domain-containing protein n=1 Tax=Symbiochloris irregularis TaxID=706552 RepID=A0AAW1NW24_9CHLO
MWRNLPGTVWQHMQLDVPTLLKIRQVCRDWKEQLSLQITQICVAPGDHLDAFAVLLQKLASVRSVSGV